MKSSNLVLMTVAIVAVGILAMPSTISLFSGQHMWYNISGSERLPCIKCHADVYAEYLMTGVHGKLSGGAHSWEPGSRPNDACYACHRWAYENKTNITYASGYGTGATPGVQAHAASTVACMACHEFNASFNPAAGFQAGGFGDPYDNASGLGITDGITEDPVSGLKFNYTDGTHTGGHAAHQGFIEGAIVNSKMEDANEACIACHTGIPVQINWTHAANLVLNATYISGYQIPPTHFKAHDFSENGTVLVISYGNWSGGAKNGSWPEGNITIWGNP